MSVKNTIPIQVGISETSAFVQHSYDVTYEELYLQSILQFFRRKLERAKVYF